MEYTYIIYLIGVITILYASLSTLRTIDVKELIAYSSVSHAAVYLLGVFSNCIQGIEGSINLGLAHGLVSPGLFICAGGILYDRSHTRLIAIYRGMAQIMPLFAILFFILCLANCGAPLSLNFIGEFLSLYGVFEKSSLFGLFASSSIIFSAAYTIYMYQKISFGGSYSKMFTINIPDLNKREFMVLLTLVVPTVLFGIYPAAILDAIHYSVSTLIYYFDEGSANYSQAGIPLIIANIDMIKSHANELEKENLRPKSVHFLSIYEEKKANEIRDLLNKKVDMVESVIEQAKKSALSGMNHIPFEERGCYMKAFRHETYRFKEAISAHRQAICDQHKTRVTLIQQGLAREVDAREADVIKASQVRPPLNNESSLLGCFLVNAR
jgi:NADH-ubiquinone oxidoreductase chain 4